MKFTAIAMLVAATSAVRLQRLSPSETAEVNQMVDAVYTTYDADNSGFLNGTEWEVALDDLSGDVNTTEAREMFDLIDSSNDDRISRAEFGDVLAMSYE